MFTAGIIKAIGSSVRQVRDLDYATIHNLENVPTSTDWIPEPKASVPADLAQTFYIDPLAVQQSETIFVTSVELFFETKPVEGFTKSGINSPGVTVYICEVGTGNVPDLNSTYHSFSSRKEYDQILTDSTGSITVPTKFTFRCPVPVKTDRVYAFVVQFDGGDPDFQLWYNKAGENVLGTTTKTQVSSGRVDGNLFKITNGYSITAEKDADLAFRVNVARFNSTAQLFKTKNSAYEILRVSGTTQKFLGGEDVYQGRTAATGTVNISATSNSVTGSGTSFNTYFVVGDKIVLTDGTSDNTDILTVTSIANNLSLSIDRAPRFTNASASFFKTVVGKIHIADQLTDHILIRESNSNSSLYLTTGTSIYGIDSGSSANIEEIVEYSVNSLIPSYAVTTPPGTKARYTVNFANNGFSQALSRKQDVDIGYRELINTYDAIYASRTTEVTATVPFSSFSGEVIFSTSNPYVSPYVYEENLDLFIEKFVINNTYDGEHSGNGQALARYISRSTNLGEQLAEDMKFFIDAYKPVGSSIKVFVKFKNNRDDETIDVKEWTELIAENDQAFSNPSNQNDIVEISYRLPFYKDGLVLSESFTTSSSCNEIISSTAITQPSAFNANTGVANSTEIITTSTTHGLSNGDIVKYIVSTGNTVVAGLSNGANYYVVNAASSTTLQLSLTDGGTAINVTAGISETGHTLIPQKSIVANDVIRIYSPLFPDNYIVDVVTSVINSTAFTISSEISNTSIIGSGFKVAKSDKPYAAFLDIQNQNVLSYFNKNGAKFQGYEQFRIKVIMLSDDSVRIPFLQNVRAIAVSA
jgi:hypothetical protein